MRLIPLLLLVFVSLANGADSPPASPDRSQQDAIKAIKNLGGRVKLDVTGKVKIVGLNSTTVTDAGLKELQAALPKCKIRR